MPLHSEVRTILAWVDLGFCIIFFYDFTLSYRKAPNKLRYMTTWGWIDLISSIPAIAFLRFGRFARLLRLVQSLRILRSARTLAFLLKHYRASTTGLFTTGLILIALSLGSTMVLAFEIRSPDSHIRSAEDALWWAFVTMTTVGYGDEFPTTRGGRVVALTMMSVGVAVFGAVSALLTSWIIGPSDSNELQQLRRGTDDIRESLKLIEMKIDAVVQQQEID